MTRRLLLLVASLAVALTCAPAAFAQTEVSTDTATATARAIGEAAGKIESTTVTRESKTVSKITAAEGFYRVVMKGHFVYNAGSPPKGYKSPEGDELEVLVNRETGDVRELHIGGEPAGEHDCGNRQAQAGPCQRCELGSEALHRVRFSLLRGRHLVHDRLRTGRGRRRQRQHLEHECSGMGQSSICHERDVG